MPLSTIADRRATIRDDLLTLRDDAATAISATTSGTAIAIAATKLLNFDCRIVADAYTSYTAGSAEWAVALQASADNSTFVTVGSMTLDSTAREYRISTSGQEIQDLVPSAAFLRVTATKTGTPGNLTYGAYLTIPC
jgi:hypothetical protein